MKQLNIVELKKLIGASTLENFSNIIWLKDFYFEEKLNFVNFLQLPNTEKVDILDIGGGAGIFSIISQYYGHNIDFTEINTSPQMKLFWRSINLSPYYLKVKKYKYTRMCVNKRYDIITSFRSDIGIKPEVWGIDEWKFFLKDISTNLLKANDSKVIFVLNPAFKEPIFLNKQDSKKWGGNELNDFFKEFSIDPNSIFPIYKKFNIFSITKQQIDENI